MSFTERLKLFRIDRKPEMSDLSSYRTHSCHPEFVKEMAFKYHLSSAYPQHNLVRLGIPKASAIVDINGVKVHLIMGWNTAIDAFGLWTIPESEENLAWFSKIFCHLLDTAQEVYENRALSLKESGDSL